MLEEVGQRCVPGSEVVERELNATLRGRLDVCVHGRSLAHEDRFRDLEGQSAGR